MKAAMSVMPARDSQDLMNCKRQAGKPSLPFVWAEEVSSTSADAPISKEVVTECDKL